MRWLERLLHALFPSLLLEGTPWANVWEEKERREHLTLLRYVFSLAPIAYIGHYYLVDVPMDLEPRAVWFNYRMGLAALNVLVFAAISSDHSTRASSTAFPHTLLAVPWPIGKPDQWLGSKTPCTCMPSPLLSSALLYSGLPHSIASASDCLLCICNGRHTWKLKSHDHCSTAPQHSPSSSSTSRRSRYSDEVRHFLAVQQNLQAQKEVIELTIEFSDRIRALLPKEISGRLTHHLSQEGLPCCKRWTKCYPPKRNVSLAYIRISADLPEALRIWITI